MELFDSESNLIASTVTDENDFYYFLDISARDHTVKVTYNEETTPRQRPQSQKD